MSDEWQGIGIEDAARLIVMPADITPSGAAMAALEQVAHAADCTSPKMARQHALVAWAWLDVLQRMLGAKPSTLGRPYGSATLAGAAHHIRLCRHYALLWCRDQWPDEPNREAVWFHLGDARCALRAWWEMPRR